jgi:hypothetical protein
MGTKFLSVWAGMVGLAFICCVHTSPSAPGADTDAGQTQFPSDAGPSAKGENANCAMPANADVCVKIGGGDPYYFEGWFCRSAECQSGFCAGRDMSNPGRCGATADEIRSIVSSGEGTILEGTLP